MNLRRMFVLLAVPAAMMLTSPAASAQSEVPGQVPVATRVVSVTGAQGAFAITGQAAVTSFLVFDKATPVDPCGFLPAGSPAGLCPLVRAAVSAQFPADPCSQLATGAPTDPCRVLITALLGTGTTANARCTLLAASATAMRPGSSTRINATARAVLNPFNPGDPCLGLSAVPVDYRVSVAPDGSITDANANAGLVSIGPAAPTQVTAVGGNASVDLSWVAGADNGSSITSYQVLVYDDRLAVRTVDLATPATTATITGLTGGRPYRFAVRAISDAGAGPSSTLSNAVTLVTLPEKLPGPIASPGAAGGARTATVRWVAPVFSGGAPITGFRVTAIRLSFDGVPSDDRFTSTARGDDRTKEVTFPSTAPAGRYVFEVAAINRVGEGPASALSNAVTPQ